MSVEKQQFIEAEIKELLDKKIIRPSTSPWASPVVVVPKKDGGSRLCVDYRGLNAKTHLDAYPMPQIQDILESLHGVTVFSTIDLKTGYWQMDMEPDSIQKTALVTSAGLFEFLRLPFGLKNAAASFQRMMEHVLRELKGKCCLVYIYVVVYSENEEKHLKHLDQVFSCLANAGLTLNLQKCNFFQTSLTFLGHLVSGDGVKTDPSKVSAVREFPVPQSLKDVQRFLGLAGWYHRFIPNFSDKAALLHALKQKKSTWSWTNEWQKAFDTIKHDLINAPALVPPDLTKLFRVQTDASEVGLGAVLTQDSEGEEHVVAYASRLLHRAEKSYSVSEKECLAVIWAVEKWRSYLEGRSFEVVTDHSALTWVFQHPKLSSRLTRWTIELFPLRVAKAPQIAQILVEEVFTRWGTPAYLVSDLGAQFTSHLINEICKQWGVTQKLTTAYHPQTNLTERVNRTLKTMMASYVGDHHRQWDRWLAEFRFAINTAWHESTGYTPSEIVLGRKLKGPLERALHHPPDPDSPTYAVIDRQQSLIRLIKENVERAQTKQKRYYDQKRKQTNFQVGDVVWVRAHPLSKADDGFMAKLSAKWKGPAKIEKRLGPVNYVVSFLDDCFCLLFGLNIC